MGVSFSTNTKTTVPKPSVSRVAFSSEVGWQTMAFVFGWLNILAPKISLEQREWIDNVEKKGQEGGRKAEGLKI